MKMRKTSLWMRERTKGQTSPEDWQHGSCIWLHRAVTCEKVRIAFGARQEPV